MPEQQAATRMRERFRIPFQSGFRWWELIAKRVDIALFMVVAQMTHLAAFQDERAAIKKHGEPQSSNGRRCRITLLFLLLLVLLLVVVVVSIVITQGFKEAG